MPWYFPWSESIKKRACRYLLQHYLGHLLREKLSLDQLSVDIYNGTGCIKDLVLDVASLNEALETFNVPIEVVDGFIGGITVSIPWSALLNESTQVEIKNLEVTIRPRQRVDSSEGIMLESMFGSMTTSLQLAKECLRQENDQPADNTSQPFEGLELFAQAIEAVLSKVKLVLVDTIVRLEYVSPDTQKTFGLEVHIKRIEYFDDMATAANAPAPIDRQPIPAKDVFHPAALSQKNFLLYGVDLYCDELMQVDSNNKQPTGLAARSMAASQSFKQLMSEPPLSPTSPGPMDTSHLSMGLNMISGLMPPLRPPHAEPIKIAELAGRQELKVKVKQNDELAGPKLDIDCQIGGITLHLSPRQLHSLIAIASSFSSSAAAGAASKPKKKTVRGKPMSPNDCDVIESELKKAFVAETHGGGFAAHLKYDSEDFHNPLMDEVDDLEFDLCRASVMDSMSSSTSSMVSKAPSFHSRMSMESGRSRSRERNAERKAKDVGRIQVDDSHSQVMKYKLRFSFIAVMVLHEDPSSKPGDQFDPGESSTEKLHSLSDKFFSRCKGIRHSGVVDLAQLRADYSDACPNNHVSLLCKPLTVEAVQKTSVTQHVILADLSVGSLELVEVVFDRQATTASFRGFHLPIENVLPEYTELLTFPVDKDVKVKVNVMDAQQQTALSPCLKVHYEGIEPLGKSRRGRAQQSKSEISVDLKKCCCEMDITIIDRLSAVLRMHQPPTSTSSPKPAFQSATSVYRSTYPSFSQTLSSELSSSMLMDEIGEKQKIDLRINCSFLTATVRFPILDLRTAPIEKPWWLKRLRHEKLIVELTNATVQTTLGDNTDELDIDLICQEAHGLFQLEANSVPVSFLRITSDAPLADSEKRLGWPRLRVSVFTPRDLKLEPTVLSDNKMTATTNGDLDSMNGAFKFSQPPPSPFSAKPVLRERVDNKEMRQDTMPGDAKELKEFHDHCFSRTKLAIELTCGDVHFRIPNKSFLELLYNRLANDLALWEPQAPRPKENFDLNLASLDKDVSLHPLHQRTDATFYSCTVTNYDDSDEESSAPTSHETLVTGQRVLASQLCFYVEVRHLHLHGWIPALDTPAQPPVTALQAGEFAVDVRNAGLFMVFGYDANPDLHYMFTQLEQIQLAHTSESRTPGEWTMVPAAPSNLPGHLKRCIIPSEPGVMAAGVPSKDSIDMLTVAMSINADTMYNRKTVVVGLKAQNGTAVIHITPMGKSCLEQVMEVFSLVDETIPGYVVPKVVTELHVHLHNCAADYRPLHLPLRVMVTVQVFQISSNIVITGPNAPILSFLVEDAALLLSKKCNKQSADLVEDYVCVAEVETFDIVLRTTDGRDQRYPKVDLRANCNKISIRTCSDSLAALAELINYMSNSGDLSGGMQQSVPSAGTHRSPSSGSLASSPKTSELVCTSPTTLLTPPLSAADHDQYQVMPDLMADALLEAKSPPQPIVKQGGSGGAQVFFSPRKSVGSFDEPDIQLQVSEGGVLTVDMQSAMRESSSEDDSLPEHPRSANNDDEFCLIDDTGIGTVPQGGEPRVRSLGKDPVIIKENYFELPKGSADLLQAPKHFPPAVCRYTLREMTVAWTFYGGKDFEDPSSVAPSTSPTSNTLGRTSSRQSLKGKPSSRGGWRELGGRGRNVDMSMEFHLNKIRLQHEEYPPTREQASRQIIVVHEIEICDRLASSRINKFLHHYASSSLPRQSHSNMFLLKALHVRPDIKLPAQEVCLKISVQPLRLNIDQDSLVFLRTFFTDVSALCGNMATVKPTAGQGPVRDVDNDRRRSFSPPPVMKVAADGEPAADDILQQLIMFDEIAEAAQNDGEGRSHSVDVSSASQPVYIRTFVFSPDVPIRLDYHGKHLLMDKGAIFGLLEGMTQLNCSELTLKRINCRRGLRGVDRLVDHILSEWLTDIKRSQLPSILGGIGPMHSLVQLAQGVRDLFWLPVEQYRRDGRIVRGLQRGANSFMTCTAMSALELTNRIVQSIQFCAETALDMVVPGPSVRQRRYKVQAIAGSGQPADIRAGVSNAYNILYEGFRGTAENLARVAYEEHMQKGLTGAVGGVLRQLPPTVLHPVIIATEATSNLLGGMRNQLLPDKKKEEEEKWKIEDP